MNAEFEKSILNFYEKKKILVTGATGFLGTSLLSCLGDVECVIRVVSRKEQPACHWRKVKIEFFKGDIRERNVWEEVLGDGVDIVFHFAAQTSSSVADADPYADFNVNTLPIIHLLNVCAEKKISPSVLFAGTASSFGITPSYPVNEGFESNPLTAYCRNKMLAERNLKMAVERGLVVGGSLRLPNLYGPGPDVGSSDRGVLNKVMAQALKGEAIKVFGQGEVMRDYFFVKDAAVAFLMAGMNAEKLGGEFYVVGSGVATSLTEAFHWIAERASKIIRRPVPVEFIKEPPDLPRVTRRNFSANYALFHSITGWAPLVSLEAGIDFTLDCLQKKISS